MRFFLCLPYCTTGSQAFGWLLEWEQTYESFPASFPHPIHGIFRTCSLNHHGSRLNRIALVGFSRSNHHSRPEQRYTEASSRNSKVEFMIMSQHIAICFFIWLLCLVVAQWQEADITHLVWATRSFPRHTTGTVAPTTTASDTTAAGSVAPVGTTVKEMRLVA